MSLSVAEIVTQKILAEIEKGVEPWAKPWVAGMPTRYVTRKPYTGINPWILNSEAEEHGYNCKYWLTWNEIHRQGGRVKPECTKDYARIVFMGQGNIKTDNPKQDKENELTYTFLRYYKVYNGDCTEGVPDLYPQVAGANIKPEFETIWNNYQDKPELLHGGSRAYYQQMTDKIQLPERKTFTSTEGYYQTLYDEAVHSTGHEKRLKRFDNTFEGFGSESYSKEELVAEIGSALFCNLVGIDKLKQSASYIKGWLKPLKNDPKMLISASSKAFKAYNYILGEK